MGGPQKNALLLTRAIRRYLASGGQTQFVLLGGGGAEVFEALVRDFPKVRYLGRVAPGESASILAGCRSILFASRWEGFPRSANEALALGTTVVGTPIPSLAGITADGQWGRVATAATGRGLAAAITAEMQAWDRGEREPAAIAAHWRRVLDPRTVCERILMAGTGTGAPVL